MRQTILTILALTSLASHAAIAQVTVPINPRGSFIRTNQDSPTAPAVRTLTSLGIAQGNQIRIRVLGEFTYNTSNAIGRSMHAVFSSSDTVLASNLQFRVPGAIDAGLDFTSANTYFGGLPTDIPQDFLVSANTGVDHVDVIVPAGATYLFIAVPDSLFNDNNDTDNDFAAEITVLCADAHCCDSIDFNNDTSFFDPQDIDAFLSVYSEGPCVPVSATCNDIDFNNDSSLFDPCDIDAFLVVFSEGPCTNCGV